MEEFRSPGHMSACVIQGLESWITYNSDKIKRVQRRSARIVKSRYLRYSSVSDMLDVLGWTPLSQRTSVLQNY